MCRKKRSRSRNSRRASPFKCIEASLAAAQTKHDADAACRICPQGHARPGQPTAVADSSSSASASLCSASPAAGSLRLVPGTSPGRARSRDRPQRLLTDLQLRVLGRKGLSPRRHRAHVQSDWAPASPDRSHLQEDTLAELAKKAAGGFALSSLIGKVGSKFGGLDIKRVYFG